VDGEDYRCIAADVTLGQRVRLGQFVNLYGCSIGDETGIGAFVEIQKRVTVGRRCKISSHSFICEGVTIEDHVFIGHGVTFINDRYPRATTRTGELQTEKDWTVKPKSEEPKPPEPPKEPISKKLLEFLQSLWRAGGNAIDVAQGTNDILNPPNKQSDSPLTYADPSSKKTTGV